jgi:hypothetical protein
VVVKLVDGIEPSEVVEALKSKGATFVEVVDFTRFLCVEGLSTDDALSTYGVSKVGSSFKELR